MRPAGAPSPVAYKCIETQQTAAPTTIGADGIGPRPSSGASAPVRTTAAAVAKPFQMLSANLG